MPRLPRRSAWRTCCNVSRTFFSTIPNADGSFRVSFRPISRRAGSARGCRQGHAPVHRGAPRRAGDVPRPGQLPSGRRHAREAGLPPRARRRLAGAGPRSSMRRAARRPTAMANAWRVTDREAAVEIPSPSSECRHRQGATGDRHPPAASAQDRWQGGPATNDDGEAPARSKSSAEAKRPEAAASCAAAQRSPARPGRGPCSGNSTSKTTEMRSETASARPPAHHSKATSRLPRGPALAEDVKGPDLAKPLFSTHPARAVSSLPRWFLHGSPFSTSAA